MNIAITGARGFIGSNLVTNLRSNTKHKIYPISHTDSNQDVESKIFEVDVLIHAAGCNVELERNQFEEINIKYSDLNLFMEKCLEISFRYLKAREPIPNSQNLVMGE